MINEALKKFMELT